MSYQIPTSGSVTFRTNTEERQRLQVIADSLHSPENPLSSSKDVIFAMVSIIENGNEPETAENNQDTLIEELRQNLEASENKVNDLKIELNNVEKLNDELLDKETPEVPENIENKLCIPFNTDELQMIEKVRVNRGKALEAQGDEPETTEEVIKNCFFDSGNLISYNGGWFTGIK